MADTAALVVALSAQLTKFEKDMQSAVGIADKSVAKINRSFEQINIAHGFDKALNFLKGGVIGAAISEAVQKIVETLDKAGEIGEIAERIGISTDALQTLEVALEESGGKAENARQALEKFGDAIGDAANGSTYLGKILQANGVLLKDQEGNLKSQDDLLQEYAKLVVNAGSSQEQLMLVTEAFGRRAGPAMLLVLKQIAEQGLPNMIEKTKDSGAVLDKEMIKRADDAADAWKRAARVIFVEFTETIIKGIDLAKAALDGFLTLLEKATGFQVKAPDASIFAGQDTGKGTGISIRPGGSTTPNVPTDRKTIIPPKNKDPIQQQIESINKHIAALNADAEAVGLSAGAQERLRVEAQLTQAILANDRSPAAYAAQIRQVGEAAEAAANRLAERRFTFNEIASASRELGSALSEAFKGAIIDGQKFDEVLSNLVRRLESKAFDKLFDLAFAPQGAATGSVFTQLITALTGKAGGGAVSGGSPYVVGEKGPELFVPGRSGMIVPNKVMAKGQPPSSRNLNVSVDVTGANGDQAIEDAVNRGVQRAVQQSVSIVNTTAPGRQLRYAQLGT